MWDAARLLFVVSTTVLLAAQAEEQNGAAVPTVGLALSGGSITAANICGSVMRGFQQQRVTSADGATVPAMDAFAYTSGLSGGNFPNLMYAFAPDTTSDVLLDADGINDPRDVTAESLRTVPEGSMFELFTKTILFAVVRAFVGSLAFGWDFWPQVVYYHFLEPLGIPANKTMGGADVRQRDDAKPTPVVEFSMVGPTEAYPGWLFEHMSVAVVVELAEREADLPNIGLPEGFTDEVAVQAAKLEALYGPGVIPDTVGQYYELKNDLIHEVMKKHGYQVPVPFMSTPEEVSSPFVKSTLEFDPIVADNETRTAEDLDFEPYVADATDEDGIHSLERLLAFGTALLPILMDPTVGGLSILPPELADLIGTPLTLDVPTANAGEPPRSMAFADGGYNDGTGIPALVHLKVRRIVAVKLMTGAALSTSKNPVFWPVQKMMPFFGVVERAFGLNPNAWGVGNDFGLHLFDLMSNGENQLLKLGSIIERQYEAGNPLIATLEDLDVVANPLWGTEAGNKVDLTIIFAFGVPKKFSDALPEEAAPPAENRTFVEDNFFTNPLLEKVPNHDSRRNIVLGEDIKDDDGNVLLDLSTEIELPMEFALGVEETRMTNFLMSWMVKEAWDGLEDADGNVLFGGFRSIFEEPEQPAKEPEPATTTTTTATTALETETVTTTTTATTAPETETVTTTTTATTAPETETVTTTTTATTAPDPTGNVDTAGELVGVNESAGAQWFPGSAIAAVVAALGAGLLIA